MLSSTAIQNVEAQTGMSVNVSTSDGTDITISGTTSKMNDVTVKVVNSRTGTVIFVDQGKPDSNGMYSFYNNAGSEGWSEDGIYRVTAKQKETSAYNLSVSIKVEDGKIIGDTVSKSSIAEINVQPTRPPVFVGLTIDVTADFGSDVIKINGKTSSKANSITIKVISPTGNNVHADQLVPSESGNFETEIYVGCPNWNQDGDYTIIAQQGTNSLFKDTAEVEIKECIVVPEFGALAMIVLVVSIVAIVVLGARSRTSIMPRY